MSVVGLTNEKHASQWSRARTTHNRFAGSHESLEAGGTHEYATRVNSLSLSNHQLFNGRYLKPLASFLSRPDMSREGARDAPIAATLHHYEICNKHIVRHNPHIYESTDEFLNAKTNRVAQRDIYFLSGPPSAEWLNCLGFVLDVPTRFWMSHLDFFAGRGQDEISMQSSLLSAPRVVSLTVPSVVFVGHPGRHLSQEQLQSARQQAGQEIQSRLQRCRRNHQTKPLYRALNVHKGDLLSVEQKISMLLISPHSSKQDADAHQGWSVFVYSDACQAPHGLEDVLAKIDDFKDETKLRFCPLALSSGGARSVNQSNLKMQAAEHNMSALSYLASEYESLYPMAEIQKPFDTLAGIFEVTLASTATLLCLLESTIDEQLEHFRQPADEVFEYATSLTFQVHRGVLRHHERQLRRIGCFINESGGLGWHSDSSTTTKSQIWEHMLAATEQLQEEVESLINKCDQGEVMVDRRRSAEQFHKSDYHAQLILRLTHITTFATMVLLPLSILTSVFGMNFQEFDRETVLGIWVWGASAAGCTVLSLVFWSYFIRRQD